MLCEVRVHDRSPFVVDGIVEVGVIVVVGVVIPDGHIVERKVDPIPAKKCAPFIDGDSEREVGEERHLTDYVDGIFGQNRLKEMEEGVVGIEVYEPERYFDGLDPIDDGADGLVALVDAVVDVREVVEYAAAMDKGELFLRGVWAYDGSLRSENAGRFALQVIRLTPPFLTFE